MFTRSGRAIKKPVVYVPTETILDDDYCTDDYDTEIGSEIDTDEECYSDESEDDNDDDADENGNLKDFVVDDDEESESEDA
jgi:hypothetical protein